MFPLIRIPVILDLGHILMISWNLSCLLKGPESKYKSHSEALRLGFQQMTFSEHRSVHNKGIYLYRDVCVCVMYGLFIRMGGKYSCNRLF